LSCAPLLEASLRYAPFGFQKHYLKLTQNCYQSSCTIVYNLALDRGRLSLRISRFARRQEFIFRCAKWQEFFKFLRGEIYYIALAVNFATYPLFDCRGGVSPPAVNVELPFVFSGGETPPLHISRFARRQELTFLHTPVYFAVALCSCGRGGPSPTEVGGEE